MIIDSKDWDVSFKNLPAPNRYLSLLKSQNNVPEVYRFRHENWLKQAYLTFKNFSSTENICFDWSEFTKKLLVRIWKDLSLEKENIALIAVGKLGGEELNLSSDIDLMFISEKIATESQIQKIKKFVKILNQKTEYGFLYRVDTDIKAGGKWGPLISSLNQFQDYYWSQGEEWERMAFVRAKIIFGPSDLNKQLQILFDKFSYRKFIDFELIRNISKIRQNLFDYYFDSISKKNINLKLSPGGIRDIELFVHALQITHGGKILSLKSNKINTAFENLMAHNLFDISSLKLLRKTYWNLRHCENLSQLYEDQQTYFFKDDSKLNLNNKIQSTHLEKDMHDSNQIISDFLGSIEKVRKILPEDKVLQKKWLKEKIGLNEFTIQELTPILADEIGKNYDSKNLKTLKPQLIYQYLVTLKNSPFDKYKAISHFIDFLKSIRAKNSFYTLLLENQPLLDDLIFLLSTSNQASTLLCNRPELLDSFLFSEFPPLSNSWDELYLQMADFKLLSELQSIYSLLKYQDLSFVEQNCTKTADKLCLHLLNMLKMEIKPDSDLSIISLGKWGSLELGLLSDLDFIFTTNNSADYKDHKIIKKFIRILTGSNLSGPIYNIDLRLRPSGNSGPVLVKLENLCMFLSQADAWVKQSYMKMRPLDSWQIDFIIPSITKNDLDELKRIRTELLKPNENNLKYSPGGLVDSELCLQTMLLFKKAYVPNKRAHFNSFIVQLMDLFPEFENSLDRLKQNYKKLRTIEQSIRAVTNINQVIIDSHSNWSEIWAEINQSHPKKIFEEFKTCLDENRKIILKLDPIYQ